MEGSEALILISSFSFWASLDRSSFLCFLMMGHFSELDEWPGPWTQHVGVQVSSSTLSCSRERQ